MKIIFRLDEILEERNISVRQLAAISGVHYRTALNIYHNRTAGISLETLAGICKALDIPLEKIFKVIKK